MSDIFISYSSKDRARAKVLAGALERQGWSVWWDRRIPPGKQFSQVIKEAMDEAKCIIVLWSKESVKSDWVQNEASEGARRKILVPMLIDDVEIPFEFRRIQSARLVDWEGRSPHPEFDTLLEALCAILGQPLLPQASEPIPDEQQPGLETEKAWSKSRMAKVLGAICIVTLITIISIGVFFNKERDRPPVDKPQGVPAKKLAPEPTEGQYSNQLHRHEAGLYSRRFVYDGQRPSASSSYIRSLLDGSDRGNPRPVQVGYECPAVVWRGRCSGV